MSDSCESIVWIDLRRDDGRFLGSYAPGAHRLILRFRGEDVTFDLGSIAATAEPIKAKNADARQTDGDVLD